MDSETAFARNRFAFSAAWFLVTALTVLSSGVLFHFPGALPPNNGEAFNLNPGGALVNGIATGVVVGGLQAWLLKRAGLRAWRWLVASTLALLLGHALGDMLPDSAGLPLMVALGGPMLGAAQWWAARWPARVGLTWTAVIALAWAASLWTAYQFGHNPDDWRAEHLVVAATVGTVLGAASSALWLWAPLRVTALKAGSRARGQAAHA